MLTCTRRRLVRAPHEKRATGALYSRCLATMLMPRTPGTVGTVRTAQVPVAGTVPAVIAFMPVRAVVVMFSRIVAMVIQQLGREHTAQQCQAIVTVVIAVVAAMVATVVMPVMLPVMRVAVGMVLALPVAMPVVAVPPATVIMLFVMLVVMVPVMLAVVAAVILAVVPVVVMTAVVAVPHGYGCIPAVIVVSPVIAVGQRGCRCQRQQQRRDNGTFHV